MLSLGIGDKRLDMFDRALHCKELQIELDGFFIGSSLEEGHECLALPKLIDLPRKFLGIGVSGLFDGHGRVSSVHKVFWICGGRVFSDDYWLRVRRTEGKQHEEGNQQGEQSIHGYLLFGWCGSTAFHAINAFNHKEATLSCGAVMLSG